MSDEEHGAILVKNINERRTLEAKLPSIATKLSDLITKVEAVNTALRPWCPDQKGPVSLRALSEVLSAERVIDIIGKCPTSEDLKQAFLDLAETKQRIADLTSRIETATR